VRFSPNGRDFDGLSFVKSKVLEKVVIHTSLLMQSRRVRFRRVLVETFIFDWMINEFSFELYYVQRKKCYTP
jgi:hypothetical protein